MGGAERGARKRRQQQRTGGKAVAAARGVGVNRKPIVIGAVVVVAIAAVVIGGVLLTRKPAPETPQNVAPVQAGYQATVQDGVVVAGKPDAAITVDIYEDFICPACGSLFRESHVDLENALAAGQLKARLHLVNFLDSKSNPPGYSLEAANAALCAAPSGKFPEFYNTLFTKQPPEGGPGYTVNQLVDIGKRANIASADFESCVRQGTNKAAVQADFAQAKKDLDAFYHGGFATPTVIYNGQSIEALNKPSWVKDLLAGKTTPMAG